MTKGCGKKKSNQRTGRVEIMKINAENGIDKALTCQRYERKRW